jgi:hypothetical protein
MTDQDIVAAARALKVAHIRADVLGGEHGAALSRAYANLLAAVGDVDEPEDVKAYRAEVAAVSAAPTGTTTNVDVAATQEQAASGG